jgi:transcriptional regulator GlxA family with amidase domain
MAVLPPGKAALAFFAKMKALAQGCNDPEETAYALAAAALTINNDGKVYKTISNRSRERILSAVSYIECTFEEPCTVDVLANISSLSRYHFMRLFKVVTGQSVNQYVINTRLRAAVARIAETKAPLSEIALDVGFNEISHFNTCFRRMFDCTPRQMRKLVRAN